MASVLNADQLYEAAFADGVHAAAGACDDCGRSLGEPHGYPSCGGSHVIVGGAFYTGGGALVESNFKPTEHSREEARLVRERRQ